MDAVRCASVIATDFQTPRFERGWVPGAQMCARRAAKRARMRMMNHVRVGWIDAAIEAEQRPAGGISRFLARPNSGQKTPQSRRALRHGSGCSAAIHRVLLERSTLPDDARSAPHDTASAGRSPAARRATRGMAAIECGLSRSTGWHEGWAPSCSGLERQGQPACKSVEPLRGPGRSHLRPFRRLCYDKR